jgi:hypothetical protein
MKVSVGYKTWNESSNHLFCLNGSMQSLFMAGIESFEEGESHMKKIIVITLCMASLFITGRVWAQGSTYDEIHLFQTFLRDTPIALTPYGEAVAVYDDYENSTNTFLGVQGGFPLLDNLEIGAKVGMIYLDPDVGGSETDMSDCMISGRYDISKYLSFMPSGSKTAAGAYVTLPIGSEDVGEDNTDYGAFGSLRYPVASRTTLTGVVGVDWLETRNLLGVKERDFSLLLGAGAIYSFNDQIHVLAEMTFQSEGDYMLATAGLDYELKIDNRIRAAIGVGLDDGAPDLTMMVSYLLAF